MRGVSRGMRVFERHKRELCSHCRGQFAVVAGGALWAVCASLECALDAVSAELEDGVLPSGRAVLIVEIAEQPRLTMTTELRGPAGPRAGTPGGSRRQRDRFSTRAPARPRR